MNSRLVEKYWLRLGARLISKSDAGSREDERKREKEKEGEARTARFVSSPYSRNKLALIRRSQRINGRIVGGASDKFTGK